MAVITQENFDFLKKLKQNNNREWFTKHKNQYFKFQCQLLYNGLFKILTKYKENEDVFIYF